MNEPDEESLLTPEQKRIIAEYQKRTTGFSRNQKPPEKKLGGPDAREEKPSWLARAKPGIQKRISGMVDTLLPRRHKKT